MHGREHQQDGHCTYSLATMSRMDLSGDGGGGKKPNKPNPQKQQQQAPAPAKVAAPAKKTSQKSDEKSKQQSAGPPGSSSTATVVRQQKPPSGSGSSSQTAAARETSSSNQGTPSTSSKGQKRSRAETDESQNDPKKKQKLDIGGGGGPKKPRLIDFEEKDTSQNAIDEFARKLSAIIYIANERDADDRCLGPYIFRWMLFVAMEQMQADKGELWFWIMYWYAHRRLAEILREKGRGWEQKSFYSSKPTRS